MDQVVTFKGTEVMLPEYMVFDIAQQYVLTLLVVSFGKVLVVSFGKVITH